MFRSIVKHFGPEWGAAVMGTAALSITLQLASEVARPFSALLYVGLGFYLLTTVLFVAFTLRFFWFPAEVKKDLHHPVRGNFFPTMPISFILAGTGTNKLGPILFIFIFGLILLRTQFVKSDVRLEHANFAWFIPPVSHLIIPVLGACSMDVYWAETSLAPWLYVISMIGLGVGVVNFLFVGAAIWHRYVYASMPEGRLAATTMVAIAPTAIIVIFLMKFAESVEAGHGSLFGLEFTTLFPVIKVLASVLWGFSFWWLIVAVTLFIHYLARTDHPVGFTWWAYTFPFEAFIVATGLLAKGIGAEILHPLLIGLNAAAVVIWIIIVFATLKWLATGAFFEIASPRSAGLKRRAVLLGAAIVVAPFLVGVLLFLAAPARHMPSSAVRADMATTQPNCITHSGLEVQSNVVTDWQYKPLFVGGDEYVVFVLTYTNHSDFPVSLTPSYTLKIPRGSRQAANEEIAAYIEDAVEDAFNITDQTPFTFELPPNGTRYDIATFEKPHDATAFELDVDVLDGCSWQLGYEKRDTAWVTTDHAALGLCSSRG